MLLGRKNGGPPEPFWDVDYADGQPWTSLATNAAGREACGWTLAPPIPAYDPATHVLAWDELAEDWRLDARPPDPEPAAEPQRITKIDFLRTLSPDEERRLMRLKRKVAALSDADYEDPSKEIYIRAEGFFERYSSALPSVLELDHPETQAAVGLFRLAGVLESDERVQQILAGIPWADIEASPPS